MGGGGGEEEVWGGAHQNEYQALDHPAPLALSFSLSSICQRVTKEEQSSLLPPPRDPPIADHLLHLQELLSIYTAPVMLGSD